MKKFRYYVVLCLSFILMLSISVTSYAYYKLQTAKKTNTFTIQEINNLKISWCEYPYDDEGNYIGGGDTPGEGGEEEAPGDEDNGVELNFDLDDFGIIEIYANGEGVTVISFDGKTYTYDPPADYNLMSESFGTTLNPGDSLTSAGYVQLPVVIYRGIEYSDWTISGGELDGQPLTMDTIINSSTKVVLPHFQETVNVSFKVTNPLTNKDIYI